MSMSCQNLFLKCLNEIDLSTLQEFLTPANSETDHGPIESYYTPDEFNNFLSSTYSIENITNKLSCCHINSRSLCRNFNNLSLFFSTLSMQPSIIGISETWLNDDSPQPLCNLHRPNSEFNNKNKHGLFIRTDISYKRRPDLEVYKQCIKKKTCYYRIINHNSFLAHTLSIFSSLKMLRSNLNFITLYHVMFFCSLCCYCVF